MALPAPVESHSTESNEKDALRLIVFDRTGTLALIEETSTEYRLPTIEIPRFTRVAEEVTSLLRTLWHAPSVLLFCSALKECPDSLGFAVLELQAENPSLPDNFGWFTVHHAIARLLKGQERKTLKSSYRRVIRKHLGEDPEPFSRLGWLSKLQEWVRIAIHPLGMEAWS